MTAYRVKITDHEGVLIDTHRGKMEDVAESIRLAMDGLNPDLVGTPADDFWRSQGSLLLSDGPDSYTSLVRLEDGTTMIDPCSPLVMSKVVGAI